MTKVIKTNLKTPISYYGGQQRSLKHILPLIPEHELYNEPFAGGAALLFAKEPAKINVINDINGELMNFYRTVVTDFVELNIEIMKTLHSREQHRMAEFIYHNPASFSNIKRAWAVWVLCNMGYAGQMNGSYGYCKTKSDCMTRKVINGKERFCEEMKELLEKCNIENDHAFNVIKRYDSSAAFHFLAPPYINTNMGHYGGLFSESDLLGLLEILTTLQGKFMLMMYPNDDIHRYSEANGWTIHKIERTLATSKSKQRVQEEWIVVNY
jgi:DNA adenine methylase